ncbi:MAG: c-type cytochrome biogenesis protein CcsB [Paenibacillaceae bacterium]
MDTLQLSSTFLLAAFIVYVLSSFAFIISITGKNWNRRWSKEMKSVHQSRWGKIGFALTLVGLVSQIGYLITRWLFDHYPISNMFEFITFLSFTIVIGFTVIYSIYRLPALGAFVMPLTVIIFSYAYIFPSKVQTLMPALQSHWLIVHVSTAALGEGLFAVGFVAGLMLLLLKVDTSVSSPNTKWLEFTMYILLTTITFIVSIFGFTAAGYEAKFTELNPKTNEIQQVKYVLPPIIGPATGETLHVDSFLGISNPVLSAPSWMKGMNAAKKLNSMVWSLATGGLLYGLLRLSLRKRLSQVASSWVRDLNEEVIDEISYRAIAIGYPIFILGALIFAMIWAEQAWGRFWGWDPKEVWALITFLFYTAYLHFRLSRGWQGTKSSWMAVLGYLVVMFTLVGVNLVLSGLHAYSGV